MTRSSLICRYASLAELPLAAPRAAETWLSPDELSTYCSRRDAARRATFLAGRILAKRMLRERIDLPATAIHIESHSAGDGRGQRPTVLLEGKPLDWTLSIAHNARGVLVALGTERGVVLGVDLVAAGESPAGLAWTLTASERRALASGHTVAQLWAMKEALYKACQRGEGFAPAQIEVVPAPRYPRGDTCRVRSLQCWRVDRQVAALAVASAA